MASHYKILLIALYFILALPSIPVSAKQQYGYFGFEPDIITNYINNKKKLGYVRVTVELMINDVSNVDIIEHHSPLLRDALIEILSQESEENIKSLTGREQIRLRCVEVIKKLMKQETGQELIKDVFFTKYLYH